MNNSDWLSLFVHQGKEFIDSVSRKGKENEESRVSDGDIARTTAEKAMAEAPREDSVVILSGEMASTSKAEALTDAEKYIYETQLEQLQEQLVDIMIQNQEMATELGNLRNGDASKLSKELEKEQLKRRQLEEKLRKIKDDDTPKLRRRKRQAKGDFYIIDEQEAGPSDKHEKVLEAQGTHAAEPTTEEPKSRFQRFRFFIYGWYLLVSERIIVTVLDIISDLSDDEALLEAEDIDGAPLAVKTLRDNIKRFSNGIKPISEFFNKINWVLCWKNPAATMLIFLVYIFSFWHGYTITLLLLLAIVQLSANFVYNKFGTVAAKEDTDSPMEPAASWSDRFQIVVHVARKVQNVLGMLSDHLEKIKNLFIWKAPHITVKLYLVLWLLLFLSLVLNGHQLFTLIGLFLGYKLFILGPLYKRFPKLKRKYDATLRLWNELPVGGSELDGQNGELDAEANDAASSVPVTSPVLAKLNSRLFSERYSLITAEVFVKGWEEGWRTSLMNRDNPLVNIKHGRLYLTQNYLCFERSRTNLEKNILMKLSDMRCVNKYKPWFILPGSGMSIEVCMKDRDEPYIFAAIIRRDEAYNDVIQAAKRAGLAWAR